MSEAIRAAIQKYRQLREDKKVMEARHKQELAPIVATMEKIEAALHAALLKMGANNVATPAGTAYFSTVTTLKVEDWEASLTQVVEHQLWHMLERRLSKTAVEQYVSAHNENFPGTQLTSEQVLRIQAGKRGE